MPAKKETDRASGIEEPFTLRSRRTHVQTHEKFLLGAFAELIDNSSEAMAKTLKIDVDHAQTGALYFLDDGIGMDRTALHTLFTTTHMSEKGNNNYGIGFKTGAFNLGEEILVLTKTYECGPSCPYRHETLAGNDSECKCAPADKKPVRSLGFLSMGLWGSAEAGTAAPCTKCKRIDTRRIKVATVFWDAEGKAIAEDTKKRETLPGSDKKMQGISFEGVEDEMKCVTRYSVLNTVEAVQRYFDKIPETGTLILLWPLEGPSSKKQMFFLPTSPSPSELERDIKIKAGSVEFLREDRANNFKPGTELPVDHSLRAYCEILHDTTVADRRKMQIDIMGRKVEPHSIAAMCPRTGLSDYSFNVNGEDQKLLLGFSEEAHTRKVCGMFVYFDQGNRLPPRLILSLERVLGSVLGPANDTNHGLVGYALVRGCRPDNGKQSFGGCNSADDGDPEHTTSFPVLKENWKSQLSTYYDTEFGELRKKFCQETKKHADARTHQGGVFWAKWDTRGPVWPGEVQDRYNREIMRIIVGTAWWKASKDPKQGDTFPRGANPENLLFKCFATQELLWCRPSDLEMFDSPAGEKLRKQIIPAQYRTSFPEAVADADAFVGTNYEDETFEMLKRCSTCNKTRKWKGFEAEKDQDHWICAEGFLGKNGDKMFGCETDSETPRGNDGRPVVAWKGAPISERMNALQNELRKRKLFTSEKIENVHSLEKAGSSSKVFRGTMGTSKYAIKIVKLSDEKAVEHLYKEMMAVFQLTVKHPNIINYYYVTDQQIMDYETLGLVMDLMERDLHDAAHARKEKGEIRPATREWISILAGVADALVTLNENKIMHRDLKPSNVLLDAQNSPKICDFGTVKNTANGDTYMNSTVSSGNRVGTPAYMAPEAHECGKNINWILADIFSFGALCVDILSPGVKPNANMQTRFLEEANISEDEKPIRRLALECVRYEPALRPKDFKKIRNTLQEIQSDFVSKLQHELPKDPLGDYMDRHGEDAQGQMLYRVLDTGDLRVLRGEKLTELPPCNPYSAATLDEHVRMGHMHTSFISTTCSPKWALYYAAKQNAKGNSFPIAVISVRKLKEHLARIHGGGEWDKVPEDFKRTVLHDWTVLAPGEYGKHNKMATHYGTDAMEVTLGVSIPIDAIVDFLWLGKFGKTKTGPIGDFFQHVSPKCAPGKFAPFEKWNTLYDRWKNKKNGVEKELFDQLAAFPKKDKSDLAAKLDYIKAHIDAERMVAGKLMPWLAYESRPGSEGPSINLFFAGSAQLDFRILSDQGFSLIMGVGCSKEFANKAGSLTGTQKKKGIDYVGMPDDFFSGKLLGIGRELTNLTNLIIAHCKKGNKVLLHCKTGTKYTAVLAAVTVMRMTGEGGGGGNWTFADALAAVKDSHEERNKARESQRLKVIKLFIATKLQDDIAQLHKEIQTPVPAAEEKNQIWKDFREMVNRRNRKIKAAAEAKREPAAFANASSLPKAGSAAAAAGGASSKQEHRPAAASLNSAGQKATAGVKAVGASTGAASTVQKASNGGGHAGHAFPPEEGKVASEGKRTREEKGGAKGGAKRSKLEGDGGAVGGSESKPAVVEEISLGDSEDELVLNKLRPTDGGGAA